MCVVREGQGEGGVCGVSCVPVYANMCVCICHARGSKKICFVSKDINKVLSLDLSLDSSCSTSSSSHSSIGGGGGHGESNSRT